MVLWAHSDVQANTLTRTDQWGLDLRIPILNQHPINNKVFVPVQVLVMESMSISVLVLLSDPAG